MLKRNDPDLLRLIDSFIVDGIHQFRLRRSLYMLSGKVSPFDPTCMHDERLTVNQVIYTRSLLLVSIYFSSNKADGRTISECNCPLAKQIGGIYAICNRTAIIHNYPASLVGIKLNISRIPFCVDQVIFLQKSLCGAVHGHSRQLSLGITEQLIFPEIDYDKIDRTRGMDITFVTTAPDDDSAFALLDALGFPFKDKE